MCQRVTLEIKNYIAYLEMTRADKRNALDLPMFKQIRAAIKTIRRSKTVRGVIFTGEGEDFCSGIDVKSTFGNPWSGLKLLWKWLPGNANLAQKITVEFRKLPIPVICVIHGRCWGGGLQIALGADFRIAHPDSMLSIMEAKWGLLPDMGGTLALRELLPVDKAMFLAMTAQELTAQEALEMNLVTEVHEDPRQKAVEMLEQLSRRSPDSVAAVKKLYHQAWHRNDRSILAKETWYQWRIIAGKNRKVAVKRELTQKNHDYTDRKNW